MPLEVLEEIERQKIEKKVKKNGLCLNCVPGLHGKTSKQKFIIKVYALLAIQLLITFGFVIATFFVPSK